MRLPIVIEIGGPDDPFRSFPSTLTQRAVRHFNEKGEPLRVHTYGHYVIDFIETHTVLTDSHFAGKRFELMDWQKRALLELYAVRLINGEWLRVHRWGLIGIPKKNGKTELAAALGLYHLVGDEEVSPRVVCAAASDDQAGLLYTAATRMCEWSPTLSNFTERLERVINFNGGDAPGELKRVAAVAGTNDGKNLSAVLIDELHEWVAPKSRAVFTVLTQGGGARKQPINIMITTAGSDQDSLCYEQYEHGRAVRDGVIQDDSFYFVWFEAPDDWDYRDPKTWEAANPSWGLILKQEFYEDIITKRRESEFCRYFLNRWMEADEIWEAAVLWDACVGRPQFSPDLPTYVGIDIGRKHDAAAVVTTQWNGEKLNVTQRFWQNPYNPSDPRHGSWSLNTVEVENYLREIYETYPAPSTTDEDGYREPGPCFLYDPHFFVRSAEMLQDEGLNMREVPQTDARMVPASQNLFELIKTQAVCHDGDPVMRRHIRSVVAKEKERGWRISRPSGGRKQVDGAVALAMAAHAASAEFDDGDNDINIW